MADATLKDVIKELKTSRERQQFTGIAAEIHAEEIQKELASLNKMFSAFFAQQKPDGDDLEEKREEKRKKREVAANEQKSKNGPSNFKDGFFQGTGLGGIFGKVKDLAGAAFAPFTGALAGVSLGGLMGVALGKVFMGVAGATLGAFLLDKHIDPFVDKITGDDATVDTMFGEIDISKIVSGIGGALGLLFGPKLIGAVVGSYFADIGGKEGAGKFRLTFLRRFGLAGLTLALASFAGDYINGLGGPEGMGSAVSTALSMAGVGVMLLGGKGLIIGALVGFAIAGIRGLFRYLNDRGREAEEIVVNRVKENTDQVFDDLAAGEIEAANKKARQIMSDIRTMDHNIRAGTTYIDELEQRFAMEQAAKAARESFKASGHTGGVDESNATIMDMMGQRASTVSDDAFMLALREATEGMSAEDVMSFLTRAPGEIMSGMVADEDQSRLVTFIGNNFDMLSKTLGDQAFHRSEAELMAQKQASADEHARSMLEVVDNNTGVMDGLMSVFDRMMDKHEVTNNSLIGRLFGTSADREIPMEAKGMGATPAMNAVDARNQSSNNTSNITNMHTGLVSQDRGLSDGP